MADSKTASKMTQAMNQMTQNHGVLLGQLYKVQYHPLVVYGISWQHTSVYIVSMLGHRRRR